MFSYAGAFYWLAVVLAVLAIPVAVLGFRWGRRHDRRWFSWAWVIFIAIGLPIGVWATFIEPEALVVHRETIALSRWSGAPVTIGLISDSHVGAPHMDAARMVRVVARMNAEHPDMVLLLGDYAGGHQSMQFRSKARADEVLDGIAAFKALHPPLGTVGVIGNHDLWYDKVIIGQALTDANVTVLSNNAVPIHRPGGDFWVAGLADLQDVYVGHSLKQVFTGVPAGATSILIAHEPDAWVARNLPYAFMAAGHTHCGQVNLPILGRIAIFSRIERRIPCHLYRHGDQALFVSGGLGISNLPVRFNAPPEIDLLTLTAGQPK